MVGGAKKQPPFSGVTFYTTPGGAAGGRFRVFPHSSTLHKTIKDNIIYFIVQIYNFYIISRNFVDNT
ncbi:hypothetical protein DCM91_01770 [Chitinophaga costaii]|nr:hypothetical protein DCM91_01770 [Chitinophaga costaii]